MYISVAVWIVVMSAFFIIMTSEPKDCRNNDVFGNEEKSDIYAYVYNVYVHHSHIRIVGAGIRYV